MKIKLIFIFIFFSAILNAQNDVDTVKMYQCEFSSTKQDGETKYTVDNKKATEAEFMKIQTANKNNEKCTPCYAQLFSAKEKIIAEGLFYYYCPNIEVKEIESAENESGTVSYTIYDNSCKHGIWHEYDKKGKPTGLVDYEYGVKK